MDLFKNRPSLAAEILAEVLGVPLPSYTDARLASVDLTEIQPAEYRADVVVVLLDRDAPVRVVIVEVQLAASWLAIVESLQRLRPASIIRSMDTTTTPQQRIEADVKAAMKAGEKDKLATLRMLLTEIKNERIRRQAEVDEDGFVSLVRKAIKQREEAAAGFHKGGREDMAAKEEAEKAFLAQYLPAQVDEGQIRAAIEELVASRGLSGPAAIGPIMKEMLARFGSSADGATINRLAREALAGK